MVYQQSRKDAKFKPRQTSSEVGSDAQSLITETKIPNSTNPYFAGLALS